MLLMLSSRSYTFKTYSSEYILQKNLYYINAAFNHVHFGS